MRMDWEMILQKRQQLMSDAETEEWRRQMKHWQVHQTQLSSDLQHNVELITNAHGIDATIL